MLHPLCPVWLPGLELLAQGRNRRLLLSDRQFQLTRLLLQFQHFRFDTFPFRLKRRNFRHCDPETTGPLAHLAARWRIAAELLVPNLASHHQQ